MLATLALTLLIAKPAAPSMSRTMVMQLSMATQNYGAATQLTRGTGLYMSPSDDIWVYPHAGDPTKDEYLRAWGANDRAIPIPGDDPAASSWSLIKWDLSGFKKDSKIVDAQIIFTLAPDAGPTTADTQNTPLEARPVKPGFSETKWYVDDAPKFMPLGTEADVFGTSGPVEGTPAGSKIVIDLMKGPVNFKEYFEKAMKKDRIITIAVTSRIDPGKVGREGIYKMWSKDSKDPTVKPVLRVVLDDSR